MKAIAVLALAACGSASSTVGVAPGSAAVRVAPDAMASAPTATAKRRWFAGDLHVHPAPFDEREGASLTVADVETLGPEAGLAWVILTPHVRPPTWSDHRARAAWLSRWTAMAAQARAATKLTVIPGTEWTVWGYGHFGVSGVDLATLGDDPLATATAHGGFVVVNHPFAVPMHIPGVSISEADLSFHPWVDGRGVVPHLDGVEVMNVPLGFANMLSRGHASGEDRAFVAADELARREHRAIAVVGGSDTHARILTATTWVLATDAREASILAALHAGATCVGGPEGGTLEARGDGVGPWATIGESVHATTTVDLRWTGRARLFVDGVDAGEHDGAFTSDRAAGTHTYRITLGASRCGFVYANLGS